MIKAKKTEYTAELIPEGSYQAIIYSILEMGTQVNPMYQTESQKIRVTYELPTELKVFKEENGEQPLVISQEYTLSISEKANLRKVIEACDKTAFKPNEEDGLVSDEYDVNKLIGKNCLITIKHKVKSKGDGSYQIVENVTMLPKGMLPKNQINETKVLEFDNWNEELFQSLPQFLKDKIMGSPEYATLKNIKSGKDNDDEVAF